MSQHNQQGLLKPSEKSPSATLAELCQEQTWSTESSLVPWLRERHRRVMGKGTREKLKQTLQTSPATSINRGSVLSGEAAQHHKAHGQVKGWAASPTSSITQPPAWALCPLPLPFPCFQKLSPRIKNTDACWKNTDTTRLFIWSYGYLVATFVTLAASSRTARLR